MTIRILCIGKLKERFYADAVTEFVKRLSRYAAVEIVELADERAPEQLSPAQREQVKSAEGRRMLARIGEGEFLVALDQRGAELSSEQLARAHAKLDGRRQKPHCVCPSAGSLGHSAEVLARADFRLSFGRPTFSHQIFRIMLLEQVYRAFKIMNGEPYHK